MKTVANPGRSTRFRIPRELRPLVIEEVRRLNAQLLHDNEISKILGYSSELIRTLRIEAGVGAIRSKTGRPKVDPAKNLRQCPACELLVDVRNNVIESHKVLRRPAACPASECKYDALTRAIEERKRQLGRAA